MVFLCKKVKKMLIYKIVTCIIKIESEVKKLEIARRIREARLEKGLTQKQLADLVGLTPSGLSKYEQGRVVNIKRHTLEKLADILDLDVSQLIIAKDPIEAAELSAKILLDRELMDVLEIYYSLDSDRKKMVRNLIRSLEK